MKHSLSLSVLLLFGAGRAISSEPTIETPNNGLPGVVITNNAPLSPQAGMFYDSLSPYGQWVWVEPYGWVWSPNGVAPDWRPYTDGSWAYTDCGWTFVADVPWGWAPFHYGRWFFHDHRGWCWAPDVVWGPAWVSWHFGDAWCGWAPLPPGVAVGVAVNWDGLIAPFGWCFVGREDFLRPRLHDHIVVAARNVTLLRETRNVTKIEIRDNRVFNVSLSAEQIERFTGRSVTHLHLAEVHSPSQHGINGKELRVFRPEPKAEVAIIRPASPAARIAPSASSWEELRRNEAERTRIEAAHRAQHDELERWHQQELVHPPQGLSPGEVEQRHQAEHQALDEQMSREHQLFEHRVPSPQRHAKSKGH